MNIPIDSIGKIFDVRYENFSVNVSENGLLSIESYKGNSTELTIPKSIGGTKVAYIGEKFFENLEIEKLYIPETIEQIYSKPPKNLTIFCFKDTPFYVDNKDSKEWNFETMYDSTYYNYNCADIPFLYNDYENYMEITGYRGDDKIIVIPSYIDGKPVTKVSFNLLGRYEAVAFPETVQEINGKVSAWLFSPVFAVEIVFTILAFIIVVATVNIILPRYKNNINEFTLSGSQIVFSLLYSYCFFKFFCH